MDGLFEEDLDPVGEREEHAARAGPHRAGAGLEVRDHLALHPDHEQDGDEQRGEDDHDLADQHTPVDPGHAGPPATVAGSTASSGCVVSGASAASISTGAVNPP